MKKFGVSDKVGYLFGDLGNDFFFSYISAFLMLYYTDALGISGGLVGLVFLLTKLFDAFIDVSWGRFIDSRPTAKSGKFKPWMMRLALPLVVVGALMFVKWPGVSDKFMLIYAFATYTLWGALYSLVNIPYGSMASVLTRDPAERGSLSTFRTLGGSIAGILISVVVPLYIFENNKAQPERFAHIAVAFAILAIACYALCYYMCTERINSPGGKDREVNWRVTVSGIKQNKPLLTFLLITIIILIAGSVANGMNAYVYKDYFHYAKALAIAGIILKTGPIVLAPFIAPMIKRFGKKEAVSVALLVASMADFAMFLLPERNIEIYLVLYTINCLGMGMFGITIWAFVTDVIDYQEFVIHAREEGTIYSIYSFCRKMGQAVAGGATGMALGYIGYVGKAAAQAPQVEVAIKNFATLVPAFANLAVFLLLVYAYPLTKEKLGQMNVALERRRIQKEEDVTLLAAAAAK